MCELPVSARSDHPPRLLYLPLSGQIGSAQFDEDFNSRSLALKRRLLAQEIDERSRAPRECTGCIQRAYPCSVREIHHARRSKLGGASHSGATAHLRFHLTFDEGEEIGVYLFGLGDCYTVSATWVNFQNRVRDDRWYATAGWTDRHDLVVFAVNDE